MKSQSKVGRLGLRTKHLFHVAQKTEVNITRMTGGLCATCPGCFAEDRRRFQN